MKILIATPLYPPDVAEAAAYSKELAQRLSGSHEVTVLAYGKYPEPINGVKTISVDKGQPLLPRLAAFHAALQEAGKGADALIVVNGPSVELPALRYSLSATMPIIFALADTGAPWSPLQLLLGIRARKTMREFPPPRPELLPLEPRPTKALEAYEQAWEHHLSALNSVLTNGN